jgi:hypothetical protein
VVGGLLSLDGVAEDSNRFFTEWDDDVVDGSIPRMIATQDAVIMGHPGHALVAITARPLPGSLRRDHEHLRRRRIGPALLNDQTRKPQPGARGQRRASVGHEGLQLL